MSAVTIHAAAWLNQSEYVRMKAQVVAMSAVTIHAAALRQNHMVGVVGRRNVGSDHSRCGLECGIPSGSPA